VHSHRTVLPPLAPRLADPPLQLSGCERIRQLAEAIRGEGVVLDQGLLVVPVQDTCPVCEGRHLNKNEWRIQGQLQALTYDSQDATTSGMQCMPLSCFEVVNKPV
jgi:hypothetical protein